MVIGAVIFSCDKNHPCIHSFRLSAGQDLVGRHGLEHIADGRRCILADVGERNWVSRLPSVGFTDQLSGLGRVLTLLCRRLLRYHLPCP